jgi:hypothetical protein
MAMAPIQAAIPLVQTAKAGERSGGESSATVSYSSQDSDSASDTGSPPRENILKPPWAERCLAEGCVGRGTSKNIERDGDEDPDSRRTNRVHQGAFRIAPVDHLRLTLVATVLGYRATCSELRRYIPIASPEADATAHNVAEGSSNALQGKLRYLWAQRTPAPCHCAPNTPRTNERLLSRPEPLTAETSLAAFLI